MKTLTKIKLTNLKEESLQTQELKTIFGGACTCACMGPSDTGLMESNRNMNHIHHLPSDKYYNSCAKENGVDLENFN